MRAEISELSGALGIRVHCLASLRNRPAPPATRHACGELVQCSGSAGVFGPLVGHFGHRSGPSMMPGSGMDVKVVNEVILVGLMSLGDA